MLGNASRRLPMSGADERAASAAADCGDRQPHMQELHQHQQQRRPSSPALCPGETWPGSEFGIWRKPLVFRPQRFTIEELQERASRALPNTLWQLQYFFVRSETLVLKRLLEDHGFIPAASMSTANIVWCGGHVKPELLLSLSALQKVNHFPRTVELTRKDLLVRTLTALRERCGPAAFDYLPTTFVLPADADALTSAMSRDRSAAWIVKPVSSSRGRGISLVSQPHQLPPCHEDVVVSKYVARPLLVDGYKFDLRLYVAITSFEPLRAYIFDEGLARFSTERYQPPDSVSSMSNQYIHLTNYSINKKSLSFVQNNDATADDHGNKWSLSAQKRCLARNGVDVRARAGHSWGWGGEWACACPNILDLFRPEHTSVPGQTCCFSYPLALGLCCFPPKPLPFARLYAGTP
jgi:tubulin polyglutamylase TTLL5